jgi:hypothetical protein
MSCDRAGGKAMIRHKPIRHETDWSCPLPRPLVIPGLMTMTTLADVRKLMKHLPAEHQDKPAWRYVGEQLDQAAAGVVEVSNFVIVLRMLLTLEKIKYREQ